MQLKNGEDDLIKKGVDVFIWESRWLEDVIGVLRGVKGRTADTIYDLFFTEKRVIAGILIHPSDFNDIYGKIDWTTLVLGNFGKQRTVKIRSLELIKSRRSTLGQKTVDEILALHRSNSEIDYVNIISVTVRRGLLTKSLEFAVQNPQGKKIRFSLEKSQIAQAEELVKRVLPGKSHPFVTSTAVQNKALNSPSSVVTKSLRKGRTSLP